MTALPGFFGPDYSAKFKAGLPQLHDKLFAHITDARQAYETDPYKSTIDLRMDALNAGDGMDFPPAGVDGPCRAG